MPAHTPVDCFDDSSYNAWMIVSLKWGLIILSFLLLAFNPMAVQSVLVDRIAGAIDGEVITYSDVRIERVLGLSEGSDREILQRVIDRRLLLREAERFKITEGDEDIQKIQKRLGDIKARMGEDQLLEILREYNLTEPDILKMLEEDLLAEKFINFRVNFFVVISNDAVKAYYSEHQDEFGARTLEEVHNEIKERLFQVESKRRLEEYIEQLKKRVKISVNL
ncbi:MAG: hypothetical protein HZA18_01350 [Nitrospirae bacterium]|nr:hypothetical protein [Nitrospirota bacterium]